jgi:exodeoxyribonuclease V
MELAFDDRKELEETELNIRLTDSQEKALTAFSNWAKTLDKEEYGLAFRLNGEAGTGKTFLVKEFIKVLKENKLSVATVAFTGKASSRLQELTGVPSCTIHRLIYDFSSMSDIKYFESSEDESKAYDENRTLNQVISKECIIIDEYSMLSREIIKDMIDLGKILIFVGDLNQLAPIGEETITNDEFNDMFKNEIPTYELTDPLRQDIYNPILSLARKVKNGLLTLKEFDTDHELSMAKVRVSKDPKLDPILFSRDENIIITYTNRLKNQLNRAVRKSLKFKNLLEIDEKIIIMQNNKENALFNGEMYRILEVGEQQQHLGFKYCSITIDVGDTDRVVRQRINVWLNPLEDGIYRYQTTQEQQQDKYEQYKMFKSLTQIAYGYAITCHKAQGSEWETVYIRYDDCKYDKKRWLYTAITRAKSKCIIKIL